ncbi:uncharacterized protein LOC143197621 [Rhynchophorus ferrugineus]|uniref:Myosuppressin n=1 Tax=Rhynchophorus ferrugineus TaxID=354439 RepID=A0A5Q0TWZ9_RHYFE|nr:hypothetical protein GWI33_003364 [Rhynchophorus ferrugineus]QGA72563.1 myosuppressin [Rhynchophorus ferrugineus]
MRSVLMMIIFGAVVGLLGLSRGSASIINCPPSGDFRPDTNPKLIQLCSLVEQTLLDSSKDRYLTRMTDEKSLNAKRQDMDHVFWRFGRSGL